MNKLKHHTDLTCFATSCALEILSTRAV